MQTGGRTLHSENNKLITSVVCKKELLEQWKDYVNIPIYKKGDKTILIIKKHPCYPQHTQFYSIFFQG